MYRNWFRGLVLGLLTFASLRDLVKVGGSLPLAGCDSIQRVVWDGLTIFGYEVSGLFLLRLGPDLLVIPLDMPRQVLLGAFFPQAAPALHLFVDIALALRC